MTASPIETPLWDSLTRVTGRLLPGSGLLPFLMVGGTDNRFFRRVGSVGYGFALVLAAALVRGLHDHVHGNDERVDVESLGLTERLWEAVAHDLLD